MTRGSSRFTFSLCVMRRVRLAASRREDGGFPAVSLQFGRNAPFRVGREPLRAVLLALLFGLGISVSQEHEAPTRLQERTRDTRGELRIVRVTFGSPPHTSDKF